MFNPGRKIDFSIFLGVLGFFDMFTTPLKLECQQTLKKRWQRRVCHWKPGSTVSDHQEPGMWPEFP